ncbi:MAG TPA: glycosyltransferase family 39 protein, partial [Mycobacteriales bacterium]|nr:glycosyltransferase family 39 protein [Mycobacteriales bacterium]
APAPAVRPLLLVAIAVGAVLVATSARYGYHRDELYFLVAGRHPDWGYPDQPPLTPLIAGLMDWIAPGSLVALRLPSALAAAATALVTGLLACELGGGPRAQLIAAACSAVSAVTLVTGHIVSTTTYDVLLSALLCWLLARAVRTGEKWLLMPAGLVLGIGLLNKSLIGVLAATLVVGLLTAGPRSLLRSGWVFGGAVTALVLGAPYLVWQSLNGWPQLELTGDIAAEGDQGGRLGFLPFQLLLVSPVLVPVWVAGLVRLLRAGAARPFRFLGIGYLLLAAVYLVTGGKAYYLAGAYPALLAAGAIATDGWLDRGPIRLRRWLLTTAVALSAVVGAVVGLAVLPQRALGPVLAVNPEAGEQVGWPEFTDTVAAVWNEMPRGERGRAVIITANYGEAGAIERYGPARGLPPPYSGHNGFGSWRVPTGSAGPVLVVGYSDAERRDRLFRSCQRRATIDNGLGLDTEEQGVPVWMCSGPARAWYDLWPEIRHLD